MKKVAVIHGTYLHRRHAGTLRALGQWYNVTAVGSRSKFLEKDDLGMETLRLLGVSDLIRRVPRLRNRVRMGTDQYLFGLDEALRDFDILYPSAAICLFSAQCARLKKKTGARMVIQELEDIPYLGADAWNWHYRQEALYEADAVIVPSERVRSALLVEGVDPAKIRQIPLGVDTEMFSPDRADTASLAALGVKDRERVVLFAGRITWEKGVFDLGYAAKCLVEDPDLRGVPIRFIFLGIGGAESALRRRLADMGLQDRVEFRGFLPYESLPAIHASVDVVVFPSIPVPAWQQQWSVGIAECMASGAPIISTLSGCTPELLKDTGVMVNPADHLTLYLALKDLLLDDAKRRELGRRARQRAIENLDMHVVARQTADVFESLG